MECPNEIFHSNQLSVRTIWVAPGATNVQLTYDISNSQGAPKGIRKLFDISKVRLIESMVLKTEKHLKKPPKEVRDILR